MNDTRERLLVAATRVFAREGISGATTRKIAEKAKVNEVTLFRYFKSKNELLRQVVLQSSHKYEFAFAEAPCENANDLRQTVEAFAALYLRKLTENEQFIRTFFGELTRHLQLAQRLFVQSAKLVRKKFIDYLLLAQDRGLIRAEVDAATAADALTGMLLAGILRRPLTETEYPNARYSKTCVELFLKGIEP